MLAAGCVALLLLALVPGGAQAALTPGPPAPISISNCSSAHASNGIRAVVTWNGNDTCAAGTASSALSIDFGETVHVAFFWIAPAGHQLDPNDARLAMNYLGFAVATRDVGPVHPGPAPNGSFAQDWSTGSLEYILAGLYSITASLFAGNGSTLWSNTFYVHVNAPYSVLALLPVLLIVIVVYELYEVGRSGRHAGLARPRGPSPPPSPPPEGSETPPPPGPASEERP